jgi:hypothetical protein
LSFFWALYRNELSLFYAFCEDFFLAFELEKFISVFARAHARIVYLSFSDCFSS